MMTKAGFPHKIVRVAPDFSWDGSVGRLLNPTKDFSHLSNAIHEFAHWLVAVPSARLEQEFGLGSAPDAVSSPDGAKRYHLAQKDEEEASLLGIAIEREIGMPWEKTWAYHCWNEESKNLLPSIQRLKEKRLISGENWDNLKWNRKICS